MRNMELHKNFVAKAIILLLSLNIANALSSDNTYATTQISSSECYDNYGQPRRCIPEFENAAFNLPIEATNTCGQEEDTDFCVQTGFSNRKSCDVCREGDHTSDRLSDLHDPKSPTWWQSETIYEGIQYPTAVNLTLNLGKSFDITYIRIVFYSPRPESFAIYKRVTQDGPWTPYQYYSATCRQTYELPDSLSIQKGESESRALCTSEYSDISPLQFGNIAFSSLEGRPSAYNFEHSIELQQWVTATDIRISLTRLNTFGDELFGDKQVLKSYFYAIADIAVGARCKCNGHANKCVDSTGLNGERKKVCECKHFTDGPDCEKCLPFYNDAPWGRATSKNSHECKPCNCNGYSNKCFFDRNLYNSTGHGGHCIDCAANRDGPNCERCKENFYMREDGYCTHCDCNPTGSRSLQCNSEGKCQCKKGVAGDKCDRCEANHFNFGSHGCQTCDCNINGSYDNTPSCDHETGFCACKENVEGRHCRECKPGFFNLDFDNKYGCTPCFCYGHTSECQSAAGYSIVSTISNFNKNKEKWTSIDSRNKFIEPKYNTPRQSIGIISSGDNVYFNAPDRFLGDQRASYNRLLKFKLQLANQRGPNPSSNDIILEGAGTKISLPIFAQGQGIPEDTFKEYVFRLHENADYSWQPSQSSRQFMSILSNLTAIKIRATYADGGEAYLDDFELQTAHRGAAGNPAKWIEQCQCPEGYVGQFCESCAPGYRHSPANGGPFMPCIPCDCNKHAEICDSETGRCICQHNTAGDNCDQCARGFYGNALSGTPYDCKRCPCPDNGACMQLPDETIICLECPIGYFGSRCEICSDGYFGDPTGASTGKVQLCQACDCNGNTDPNAVGNCNRTNGECMKCIHNTDGPHCDQCLPGHFGDPYASPHGSCEACSCYPRGTIQSQDGISLCDAVSGSCECKPNVVGKNCNECQNGYWNIASGEGCQSCKCDPIGSFESSCDTYTGQCSCKPGITGLRCDKCEAYQYGFSTEGCKLCDCDASGSKSSQCDEFGQCPCNDNVEGRTCNRCKENKHNRHQGCLDCPACYNLVQDAVNEHRSKLSSFDKVLMEISENPTVIEDHEFESKLKALNEKVNIVLEDAKSGAGGGTGKSLTQKMEDLREQLTDVDDSLKDVVVTHEESKINLDLANDNLEKVQRTIQQASDELNGAMDLIQVDGVSELARAKNKSNQFDQQSEQMSDISRNARKQAEDLEKAADSHRTNAKEAKERAINASDIAKNTIDLQRTITDQLKFKIAPDFPKEKKKLDALKKLTTDSLDKANSVYDESLTLFANVNGLAIPEVDLNPIKEDASKLAKAADEITAELDEVLNSNNKLLSGLEENIDLSTILIKRADAQKEDALETLAHIMDSKHLAESSVADGDDTLKKANNTYHLLKSFNSEVQTSSDNAKIALQDVPAISQQIRDTQDIIRKAEEALEDSYNNADKAKNNAQEAQERYADQASKDAEAIRNNANNAKNEAQSLHSEANNLRTRIGSTESRFGKLEDLADKDDELTETAKAKVGQAKTDSEDVQKQMQKALDSIKSIIGELENMKEISIHDLDLLDQKLNATEAELEKAKLNERIDSLRGLRNHQNSDMKGYKAEISQLEKEVANIKQISSALPNGCFKRTRLEP